MEFTGWPAYTSLACGSIGYRDYEAEYPSYRCMNCFAVYGSVGMPDSCKSLAKEKAVEALLKNAG